MKLALIPPNDMAWTAVDNYHLILPQNWRNPLHEQACAQRWLEGGFFILDNGAAEGLTFSQQEIVDIAWRYRCQEIVLRDVMNDAEATEKLVEEDIEFFGLTSRSLMAVVQGKTVQECKELIDLYVLGMDAVVNTIGIPRHLITTIGDGDDAIRVSLASHIRRISQRVNIHLLGTCPDYITELKDFGKTFRRLGVRGIDTSAPFVYAYNESWIGDGDVCVRPKDYFNMTQKYFDERLVQQNIDTLTRWVHG
jgi:hypothetical protein